MTIQHWPVKALPSNPTPESIHEQGLAIRYNLEGILAAHKQGSPVLAWTLTQQLYDALGGAA